MSVFDRLYRTETESSKQKRRPFGEQVDNEATAMRSFSATKTTPRIPSVRRLKTGATKGQPSNQPQTKVLMSNRESPHSFENFKASATTLRVISQYESGEVPARNVATILIDEAFQRDFSKNNTGSKWDVGSAQVDPVEGQENCFDVAKEGTYNRKDIYMVASSKTRIHFLWDKKEIHLKGYSYHVAG